jgi:SAM-dependent methyltransferase
MASRIEGAIALIDADRPPGLALDLSGGDGEASAMLASRGWRVITTELRPSVPGWVAADLQSHVPFRDSAFDLVVMLEVIEHLENIPHAMREVARVLKPRAIAIITTPNRLNASSRVHYLLSGFYKGRRAPLPYRYGVKDGRNWNVMGLNDLDWIAHSSGLRLEAIGRGRRKLRSVAYAGVLWLPVKVFSYLLYGRGSRDPAQAGINRALYRHMTCPSVLMDENLLMRFRKIGE